MNENVDTKFFFTEVVFVTQLSSNAGISVWRIEWVTTKYDFMNDK